MKNSKIIMLAVVGVIAAGSIGFGIGLKSKPVAKSNPIVKVPTSKKSNTAPVKSDESSKSVVLDKSEPSSESRPMISSPKESVSEKEIETAGETGEHSEKAFDVKVDGSTVSAEDIANARKTLKDAGINDGVYSDLDIAKVIKAASDKSLDIVTVAKDGKF